MTAVAVEIISVTLPLFGRVACAGPPHPPSIPSQECALRLKEDSYANRQSNYSVSIGEIEKKVSCSSH
jgi:hypothetical protein